MLPAAAQPLGSPDLEPGLRGRPDVIFFEDFESAAWPSHFRLQGPPQNTSLAADAPYQGRSALRVRAPAGSHYGTTFAFKFAQHGLPEPDEVHFRYYLRFDAAWGLTSQGTIGKLPGLGGTYDVAGWGGKPSHGDDGWSARMLQLDRGAAGVEVGYYVYHADMTGLYGTNREWNVTLARNRWYAVEVYGKVNTITAGRGNRDGVLIGWIDGRKVFEARDIRFRDVPALKIEKVWMDVYVGGSWTAPRDMSLHIDNVVIARNPIGPRDSSAVVSISPRGGPGILPGTLGGALPAEAFRDALGRVDIPVTVTPRWRIAPGARRARAGTPSRSDPRGAMPAREGESGDR